MGMAFKRQPMPTLIPPNNKRLTAQEVADLLGYNLFTIYKWARIGRIPCIKLKRQYRFRLEDIEKWEDRQSWGKL